jgi:hypothetical protein
MPESVVRYPHRSLDVACSLDAAAIGERGDEWRELRDAWLARAEAIPDGARLWLTAGAWEAAGDLARREADCCGFLDFEVAAEDGPGGRVRLDITSPVPEGRAVIAALTGTT